MKDLLKNIFIVLLQTISCYVIAVLTAAPILFGCIFLINRCTHYEVVTIKEQHIISNDTINNSENNTPIFNTDEPITIIK